MKLHKLTIAGAVAGAAMFAGISSQAAVFNNVSGVIHEGGGAGTISTAPAASSGITISDFSTTTADPLFNVIGDTSIYGGVRHSSPTNFVDGWSMDFGSGVYDLVFNWQHDEKETPKVVDGRIIVNGVATAFSGVSGTILSLGSVTGLVTFVVDPIFGSVKPTEDMHWDLHATVVPLPAGGVLLLTGLAGLAMVRRRKNA
eukprot:NODE_4575_length_787_cov_3.674797_g3802_i0.p1 GENE.NODE_4575_length_787_cov_3.674797_g3802_i0~~NODE_4575_length_787_cov_3.674797_g3802_i0.p1  ORF type:complete len:200 (+),score=21.79 NODE_4575_length_787_cov_3.674797_g3802_i0:137-736(+)